MSFFGKLKQRLFTSSSRLDQGLDAIVAEGGEAETEPDKRLAAQEPEVEPTPEPDPEPAPEPTPDPQPEPEPEPEPQPLPEPEEPEEPDYPEEIPEEPDTPQEAPEEIPGYDQPEEVPQDWPSEVNAPQGDTLPGPAPMEIPVGTPPEILRGASTATATAYADAAAPTTARVGFLGRLLGRSAAPAPEAEAPATTAPAPAGPVIRRTLDDAMLEQLEELLIASDMGVDTALRVTANLAEGRYGRKLSVTDIKRALADEIARIMEPVARPMPIFPKTPQVVLVVGVNGSGKTTTIGKLASQFRAAGKTVIIAAGDTFRAAAVEQLQVWGDRAGVPVLTAPEGSDPASLAYDAMTKAEAEGADLLLIDTAGRLQNRADLMEELSKIVRVIRKKDPTAPHNTLLVLDATTGQNALSQVEIFRKLADVSGLVMTKLDGTAKGGVLVALADKFGLPIHAIGVGEQIDDLAPFDPQDFARALTGLDA
ncbi:MAG: signal recognition particle-docking protein FtsY [Rhodobacterales bacterium]|nr:signal recognition particle-docking protein FtsY [Rhodobacterales bacterium]MDX5413378.1 signal recognition particle-docking protein FtsY [Rhodobacterales bacterium]